MKRIYTPLILLILIMVLFSGCDEPVIVEIAPSKPVLTSPIDSEQTTGVRLNWSTALRANSYDIYMGKTLGTIALIAQNVSTTFYDVTGLDPSSLYYWRIIAKNNAGNTSSDSKVFSTQALRAGNYIEIRDIATNSDSNFSITLFGNVSNVRAIEVVL
ncbi:MAG: fibronectin type III domain-containing protein [Thermotogota bacterium]|nr:fibronectin type III domain-containing protein [Thermotogota bacterium]